MVGSAVPRFKEDTHAGAGGYECARFEAYQDIKGATISVHGGDCDSRRWARASGGRAAGLRRRRVVTVGVLRLTLYLPENHSLKGKRSVLRTIKARVQNKFNVSIAECEDHDLWQRITLGVSQVGADEGHVDSCLRSVVRFIEDLQLAELGEERVEFLHY